MKAKIPKQILIGLVLALALTAIVAAPVYAGLAVTGAKIQDSLTAGSVKSYVISVADTTTEPMDIGVEIKGFGNYLSGAVKPIDAEEDISPYTAREWVTASPSSFHLEPGQSQAVTITVNVPNYIGDGGRYAIIYIHNNPSGSGVVFVSAIATQVILTIGGSNPIISGDITSLNLAEPNSEQPFAIAATVSNTGNYHYKLTFNGTIKDNLGQEVGSAYQSDSMFTLIPTYSQQANVFFNISQELVPGIYTAEIVAYTSEGIFLGSSTLPFALTQNYKPVPLTHIQVDFWDIKSGRVWEMGTDGTLLEDLTASSLTSTVTISIAQGARVYDSNGQAAASISVTLMDPAPPPPTGYRMISAFKFLPGDITFDPKADITLEYTAAQLSKGISEANLKVARFDQDTLQWTILGDDELQVNPGTNKITFSTKQSGIYAIVAPPSSTGLAKTTWIWIGVGLVWIIVVILIMLIMSKMKRKKSKKPASSN